MRPLSRGQHRLQRSAVLLLGGGWIVFLRMQPSPEVHAMYGTLLALSLAVADSPDRVTIETGQMENVHERLLRELKKLIEENQNQRRRTTKDAAKVNLELEKRVEEFRRNLGGPELSCSGSDTAVEDLGKTEQETEMQAVLRLVRALAEDAKGTAYLGLTEQQLRQRLGNPTSAEKGVWCYERSAPAGIEVRVVRFADGKVVSARLRYIEVGCRQLRP
jgi:hypothetical protein